MRDMMTISPSLLFDDTASFRGIEADLRHTHTLMIIIEYRCPPMR